jgi:hypothetical protein
MGLALAFKIGKGLLSEFFSLCSYLSKNGFVTLPRDLCANNHTCN